MEHTDLNPVSPNQINQNPRKKISIILAFILIILVIIGGYIFFVLSKKTANKEKSTETSSKKTAPSEIPLTINGYFLAPEVPQKSAVSLVKYNMVFNPDEKIQLTPYGNNKLVAFDLKNGSTTKIFGTDLDIIYDVNSLSGPNAIEFHGFFPDRKRLIFEQNLPFKNCLGKESSEINESILWIADLEKQTFYHLFNKRQGFAFSSLSLSPDGKTIIGYGGITCPQKQLTSQERFRGMFLFDIENSQMQKIQISNDLDIKIAQGPPSFILWAPDGSSIVFNVDLDVYKFNFSTNKPEKLFQLQKKSSVGPGRMLDDGRIIYIDKNGDCEFGLGFFTYVPNGEIKSICPPDDILQSFSIGIDPTGTFAAYGVPHQGIYLRATVIQNLENGEVNTFSVDEVGAFGSWWAE